MNKLLSNLDKLHTTEMGVERIKKNLNLDAPDVIAWCEQKISDTRVEIKREGKNWYIVIDGCKITVNAHSYTVITAHKTEKPHGKLPPKWQYSYQRPLGKIEDDTELRDAFIEVFDTKSKPELVRFGIEYARYLISITDFEQNSTLDRMFRAMERYLDGSANYHEARNIAFEALLRQARIENDAVKERFYRTMAQIAAIPHVKFHALWASDFAVTMINRMYPNDIGAVRAERTAQIAMFERI